jgi:release factor glutamine methyltransferase
MTRREALLRARELLADNAIEDAALEAELLLRHTLYTDRSAFYAGGDNELTAPQDACYRRMVEQRVRGMPSAYITGEREFYGLPFYINESVLIPRPETELLAEKAIELARGYEAPQIADIGTGSGAIAISLALNLPDATVVAIDISQGALNTARRNCERHRTGDRVRLCRGDLLEAVPYRVDIIVANLPYVRTADVDGVNTCGYEPRIALDGGEDGLEVIRRFCRQTGGALKPGGSLLMEIGAGQRTAVIGLLRDLFPSAQIDVFPDLAGIDRAVCLTLPQ